MLFPARKLMSSLKPKLVSLLVLVSVCLAVFPIPVSTIEVPLVISQRFPCEHGRCGCATAEHCWTACCCNSPAQRLDWAKKNGVTPPAYAVLTDERTEPSPSKTVAAAKAPRACCSHKVVAPNHNVVAPNHNVVALSQSEQSSDPVIRIQSQVERLAAQDQPLCGSVLKAKVEDKVLSCCKSATVKASPTVKQVSKGKSKRVFVISVEALKCQGQSSDFILLPWAIVRPIGVASNVVDHLSESTSIHQQMPLSIDLSVDLPPPRHGA